MTHIVYHVAKTGNETDVSFYALDGSFQSNANIMKQAAKWFYSRKIKPANHTGLIEVIYYGGIITIIFRNESLAQAFIESFIKSKANTFKFIERRATLY